MHVFGLTGGIASGKSAVAAFFRARGVPVIDADAVAREVVAPGSPALTELVLAFGEAIKDGEELDRKKLAAMVFADPEKRRILNAIVHPRIAIASAERTRALAATGAPLACYEAALLVENGLADAFRPLIVVACPIEIQIARATLRDGEPEATVRGRILAQMPLADKVKVANLVIDNTGDRAALDQKAAAALVSVCRAVGIDPSRYGLPSMER